MLENSVLLSFSITDTLSLTHKSALFWLSLHNNTLVTYILVLLCDLCFYCYKLHLKVTFTTVQSLYAPVHIVYKSKYTDSKLTPI